jgi:hypothetical protein
MDLASAWMDPMFVPSPGMDGGADVPPGAAPADANSRRRAERRHKGGASGHTSNSTYSNHKSSSGASGYADADDGVGVLSPHGEHRKRGGLKPSADDATGAEAETNAAQRTRRKRRTGTNTNPSMNTSGIAHASHATEGTASRTQSGNLPRSQSDPFLAEGSPGGLLPEGKLKGMRRGKSWDKSGGGAHGAAATPRRRVGPADNTRASGVGPGANGGMKPESGDAAASAGPATPADDTHGRGSAAVLDDGDNNSDAGSEGSRQTHASDDDDVKPLPQASTPHPPPPPPPRHPPRSRPSPTPPTPPSTTHPGAANPSVAAAPAPATQPFPHPVDTPLYVSTSLRL